MEIRDLLPILIYDDRCYHCSKFASIIKSFAGKKILIVGHYTKLGSEIKAEIFADGYEATRMFWFVNGKHACGGRAGVFPLLKAILSRSSRKSPQRQLPLAYGDDCRTPMAFFARTKTLLSNSQRIPLRQPEA